MCIRDRAEKNKATARLQQSDHFRKVIYMLAIKDKPVINQGRKLLPVGISRVVGFAHKQNGHLRLAGHKRQFDGSLTTRDRARGDEVRLGAGRFARLQKSPMKTRCV